MRAGPGIDFLCRIVEPAITLRRVDDQHPGHGRLYDARAVCARSSTTVFNRVPNIDKAVISVHCHNDLGMATANSLTAVSHGARQIECAVNGLGERAGNAALEEVVMALKVRQDLFTNLTVGS